MKTPRFWKKPSVLGYLLWPLSVLYRLGNDASRSHHKPITAPLPVISIGNVTAGGAGKTPTALALLPMLQALGTTPHFVTRGYKAAAPLTAHRVADSDDTSTVGDEALLLARLAPTWVGRDRLASARAAKEAGATHVVCDDALQHYRLKKDISFLVIDGPYGLGNGFLLPAGPLRETLDEALARCHAVVMIGEDVKHLAERISLPVFRAKLTPTIAPEALNGKKWLAFAGIGRPEKFFETLRGLHATLAGTHSFPDHHHYTAEDMAALTAEAARLGAQLITTEKDAVKLTPEQRAMVTVLPVMLTFDVPDAVRHFLTQQLHALTAGTPPRDA